MSDGWPLIYYIVYDHPRDYPYKYVVRRWYQDRQRYWPDDKLFMATEDLGMIHRTLEALGLNRLLFQEEDPNIIETWL